MMYSNLSLRIGCVLGLGFAYLLRRFWLRKPRTPLPPGPKPKFLIGNMLDVPRERPCVTYLEWYHRYGPIVYLDVIGTPTVILNTYKAAADLLVKRGRIYSDRPRIIMTCELVGLENNTSFKRFGPQWKRERKLMSQALNAAMVRNDYSTLQEYKTREYLYDLLQNPGNVLRNLGRMVGETISDLTYGAHQMDGVNFMDLNNEITVIFGATYGRYLVDVLPILKKIPSWFPGATGKFKRDAKKWRSKYFSSRDYLFNATKSMKASNPDMPTCYVSRLLDDLIPGDDQEAEEEAIRASSFTFYRAGTNSTRVTIESFLLAMTLCPAVQHKAQAEVDGVVKDRLPTVVDQDNLPYTKAVILEVLRWSVHVTTGVPHRLMEDDIYEGYFLPAGTTIIANAWAMSRDATTYPNPDTFDPERFYSRDERDPREYIFGFGRRACPGIHLAMQAIILAASSILWSFNVKPREDLATFDPKPQNLFDLVAINHPLPFECKIEPRSSIVGQRLSEAVVAERPSMSVDRSSFVM